MEPTEPSVKTFVFSTVERTLCYMLGSWFGGVGVTFAGYAAFDGQWTFFTVVSVVTVLLGVGLIIGLRRDQRTGLLG